MWVALDKQYLYVCKQPLDFPQEALKVSLVFAKVLVSQKVHLLHPQDKKNTFCLQSRDSVIKLMTENMPSLVNWTQALESTMEVTRSHGLGSQERRERAPPTRTA